MTGLPGLGSPLEPSRTLAEQVASRIEAAIREGSLKRGEKLPTEAEMAGRFGVSRTVIREALSRLKYDGLLDSRQGVGCVVAGTDRKRAFRIDDVYEGSSEVGHLYELRAVLEGDAAFLAASRRTPEQLGEMGQTIERMARAVREGKDGTLPDLAFHRLVAEATQNPYLLEFMSFLTGKLRDLIARARENSSRSPGVSEQVQLEHEAIHEAIRAADPEASRAAALIHVRNAGGRLGYRIIAEI